MRVRLFERRDERMVTIDPVRDAIPFDGAIPRAYNPVGCLAPPVSVNASAAVGDAVDDLLEPLPQ